MQATGGVTNRGRKRALQCAFQRTAMPSQFFMVLCTAAFLPDDDTNKLSDLEEIDAGNGYPAGGYGLTPGIVDFVDLVEDDINDRADLRIKDVEFLAAGGPIPASGDPIRVVALVDDLVDPDVWAWWDFGVEFTRTEGESLILAFATLRAMLPKP